MGRSELAWTGASLPTVLEKGGRGGSAVGDVFQAANDLSKLSLSRLIGTICVEFPLCGHYSAWLITSSK